MDFFDHQEQARKQTTKLVVLFGLAVIGIIAAIYAVAMIAFAVATEGEGLGSAWSPEVFGMACGGTLLVVGLGSLYKTAQLRAGGSVVATQLGGRLVAPNTTDAHEKKLLNVVEEMSVASGTPVPSVFVMDREQGINAFAAGFSPSDAVVGVTRGCIEQLDRDELQGVIAHEFSHIINGDMRLNIRLIGVLHGILCIALAGYLILRSGAGFRSRGNNKNGGILGLAIALVAIGYIGMFFARLIQAAVSRQREFLADASAVQYTRNPKGISGALKKIGGFTKGARIENGQAEATSHMFFGNALKPAFASAFATHPPLAVRIERIEGTFRALQDDGAGGGAAGGTVPEGAMGFAGAPGRSPSAVVSQTGSPTEAHIAHGRAMLRDLPLAIGVAIHEPFSARALVFALLLDRGATARRDQLRALERSTDAHTLHETVELSSSLADVERSLRLPLVDLAMPALREMSPRQFETFARDVGVLIAADDKVDLFEFALQKVLLRHLSTSFTRLPRTRVKFRTTDPVLLDCQVLLSRLARIGHTDDEEARAAHSAGMDTIPGGNGKPLLAHADCGLAAVDRALDRLAQATPRVKQILLRACAETVAHDGEVQTDEGELLRAIADSLDCPIPPLLK